MALLGSWVLLREVTEGNGLQRSCKVSIRRSLLTRGLKWVTSKYFSLGNKRLEIDFKPVFLQPPL